MGFRTDRQRTLGRTAARLIVGLALALPPAATASSDVVELPVSFDVQNTSTSGLPCLSDGAAYTVRGHITGPRAALASDPARTGPITVYLYGFEEGEFHWAFKTVPGYDYATQMAELGHVSLTLSMLGYLPSGQPNGPDSCWGSQADVTHQIIGQLRSGEYTVEGASPLRFSRIALAGRDVGGAIAQIEAYSYKDIDALLVFNWADQGFTPYGYLLANRARLACARGGEPAQPGGPPGYIYFAGSTDEYRRDVISPRTAPAVAEALVELRTRNPCGYASSISSSVAMAHARLGEITVPVLLQRGIEDPIFTPDGYALQQYNYTGSSDVTLVQHEEMGHYPTLEPGAPRFRDLVSEWLSRRGFVSRAVAPARPVRLSLSVRPRRARLGRRTRFVFRVAGIDSSGIARRIAGVTVRFAGRSARTDARGRAVIRTTFRRPGRRRARATKQGTRPARTTVTART